MLVNLNEILNPAKEGKYGVGFFNAVNVEMARAIIETAEEMNAPVIVGTAEVLLPVTELVNIADYLIPMAKRASVPVCVHYDHGLTLERCMQALDLGFSSIMYDCSTASFEENTERVAKMVELRKGKMTPEECKAALAKLIDELYVEKAGVVFEFDGLYKSR